MTRIQCRIAPVALVVALAAIVSACAPVSSGSAYGGIPLSQRTGGGGLCDSPYSLSAAQIHSTNAAYVEEILGLIPGVLVRRVGGGYTVQIRGASSFSASTEPLYVIDGMAVTGTRSGKLPIQPQDIECIEVLKEASHTAMFGSRGANGVVLITTRRGY